MTGALTHDCWLTPSEWEALLEKPQSLRQWHTDAEVCEAAGITERMLLLLQTLKVIRATKVPRVNGGYMRTWSRGELYIAAAAGKVAASLDWPVVKTATLMRIIFPVRTNTDWRELFINDALDTSCVEHTEPGNNMITAHPLDWTVSVCDLKFVFLTIPSEETREAVGAFLDTFPIGVGLDTFAVPVPFPFAVENPKLNHALEKHFGRDEFANLLSDAHSLRRAKASALTSIKINIAMPVRAEAIRLNGGNPMYAGDAILKDLGDDWQERFGIKE